MIKFIEYIKNKFKDIFTIIRGWTIYIENDDTKYNKIKSLEGNKIKSLEGIKLLLKENDNVCINIWSNKLDIEYIFISLHDRTNNLYFHYKYLHSESLEGLERFNNIIMNHYYKDIVRDRKLIQLGI